MTHGAFIFPSYILTVGGLFGALAWSLLGMVRAERAARALRRRREP